MSSDILRETARILADKIKIKGWLANIFKRTIIEAAISQAYEFLNGKSMMAAVNFRNMCEAYNTADKNNSIDQAAELLAAIVKQVFYPENVIKEKYNG